MRLLSVSLRSPLHFVSRSICALFEPRCLTRHVYNQGNSVEIGNRFCKCQSISKPLKKTLKNLRKVAEKQKARDRRKTTKTFAGISLDGRPEDGAHEAVELLQVPQVGKIQHVYRSISKSYGELFNKPCA